MRFDLHIHSNHSSDSGLSVDDILRKAVEKGLDGIAICDHDNIAGSYHARKRSKELNIPLLVLPGVEVSTKNGHLLVLGIKENIPAGLSAEDTIKKAKQNGSVIIAAHPFKIGGVNNLEELDIDAIETFNSRCMFGENKKAEKLALKMGKPQVGGSDSHMLSTIGLGYTEIDAEPYEESILKAIREGKTRPGGHSAPFNVIVFQVMRGIIRRLRNAL